MTSQLERPARPGTVTVTNPVLRGFHPDPSIVRVGEDYYLATSTFQWYPGVAIYHSRDLVNWRPAAQPLARTTLLDMRGNADSGGIWAPALSHDGERFHLIYTDVKSWGSAEVFKDSHNFLTTAEQIEGPWSEPVYLNSSGFDPSLFHDTPGSTVVDEGGDGRKWFVNMRWDHRQGRNRFSGIVLQEYSPEERRLVGPRELIFEGTELGVTEAPHLFRRGGWYYLLTAEGGTSYEHAVTLARSRSLHGPYEVHPDNPVLSAVDAPGLPIQKSGHASFTNTPDGQWLLAYLCGRPLSEQGECPLGRETALQALVWGEDGWPRLASGGHHPSAAHRIARAARAPVAQATCTRWVREHDPAPRVDDPACARRIDGRGADRPQPAPYGARIPEQQTSAGPGGPPPAIAGGSLPHRPQL